MSHCCQREVYLHYPLTGLDAPAAYNRATVKIELSGRAEGWPMEDRLILPYAAAQFPKIDPRAKLKLSCVRPERTFWEKAALVHEQNVRPGVTPLAPRQARHLYDLTQLWGAAHSCEGLGELFGGVVQHRKTYFDYNWIDYDSLSPAKLQLIPSVERLAEWQADYRSMGAMFFGDPPSFEQILSSLRMIEEAISKL